MHRFCLVISFMFAIILVLLPSLSPAQHEPALQDVVYLKNGSIIRGTIVEQIPDESIKIRTADGSIFVYSMSEVINITREKPTVPAKAIPQKGKKDPGVALLLSFFLPGVGQFYNGEYVKGAIFLGAAGVGSAMLMAEALEDGEASSEAALLFVGVWAAALIDAPISASRINKKNGYTIAPFPNRPLTVTFADLSKDTPTAPGVILTWHF